MSQAFFSAAIWPSVNVMTTQSLTAVALVASYVGHTSLQSWLAAPKVTEGNTYGARCAACPSCPDCSCTGVVILVASISTLTGLVLGGVSTAAYLYWRSRHSGDQSHSGPAPLDRVEYGRRRGLGQLVDVDTGPQDLAVLLRRRGMARAGTALADIVGHD